MYWGCDPPDFVREIAKGIIYRSQSIIQNWCVSWKLGSPFGTTWEFRLSSKDQLPALRSGVHPRSTATTEVQWRTTHPGTWGRIRSTDPSFAQGFWVKDRGSVPPFFASTIGSKKKTRLVLGAVGPNVLSKISLTPEIWHRPGPTGVPQKAHRGPAVTARSAARPHRAPRPPADLLLGTNCAGARWPWRYYKLGRGGWRIFWVSKIAPMFDINGDVLIKQTWCNSMRTRVIRPKTGKSLCVCCRMFHINGDACPTLISSIGFHSTMIYSQWNSHLIGIMISKTIGFRGLAYFQTHPPGDWLTTLRPATRVHRSW